MIIINIKFLYLQPVNYFLTFKNNKEIMKKLHFFFAAVLVVFATSSITAATADLFAYNEQVISAQMADLNELESYVKENEGITLHELNVSKAPIINKINMLSPLDYSKTLFSIENMDWTSFAWGLCCWPVGVFTVLLNDSKDTDAKISYFIGAGIAFVMGTISSITYRTIYIVAP